MLTFTYTEPDVTYENFDEIYEGKSGIYVFRDCNNKPLYVGKTTNLREKMNLYTREDSNLKLHFIEKISSIDLYFVPTSFLDAYKILMINYLNPKYNNRNVILHGNVRVDKKDKVKEVRKSDKGSKDVKIHVILSSEETAVLNNIVESGEFINLTSSGNNMDFIYKLRSSIVKYHKIKLDLVGNKGAAASLNLNMSTKDCRTFSSLLTEWLAEAEVNSYPREISEIEDYNVINYINRKVSNVIIS